MADPFEALRDSDPFSALRGLPDPFAALRGEGMDPFAALRSERRRRAEPTEDPDALEAQLAALTPPKGVLSRAVSNAPRDVKDIVRGLTKFGALAIQAGADVPRMGFNTLTGDTEEAEFLKERVSGFGSMLKEGAISEWDRVKHVYGSMLKGQFEPLKEQFAEQPVSTLLDVAAVADVAAIPVKGVAGSVRAGAIKTARKAVSEDDILRVNANHAQLESSIQRLAKQAPEEPLATTLDKTAEGIRLGNPFRLAYKTIGSMPPFSRLQELGANSSRVLDVMALNLRRTDDLKATLAADVIKGFKPAHELDDVSRSQMVYTGLGKGDISDLSPDQQLAFESIKGVGESMRDRIVKSLDPEQRAKFIARTDATMESRAIALNLGVSLDDAREIQKLDVGEKLGVLEEKIAGTNDLAKRVELEGQANRLYEQKIVKEMAHAKRVSGELFYLPGRLQDELFDLTPTDGLPLGQISEAAESFIHPSSPYLSKKKVAEVDPMAVEDQFIHYAQVTGQMLGRKELRQRVVQDFVTDAPWKALDPDAVERALRTSSAIRAGGKGFEPITLNGETRFLPVGMKRLIESGLSPKGPSVALKPLTDTLDFTRNEFAKVVLGLSPTWFVYNTLGNAQLFAMAAGSPIQLGRALGLRVSSGLEKYLTKHGHSTPRLVADMAKTWRELYPRSITTGIVGAEYRFGNAVEYVAPYEKTWAQKYSRLTQRAAGPITQINEFVEEVYRGALWMSNARKQARKELFMQTGSRLEALNSEAVQQKLVEYADALKPIDLEAGVPLPEIPSGALAAVSETNKFLNDYYRLGPIERGFFRRLFPFYSWIKFTNRLAAQLPVENPLRVGLAAHMSNVVNDAFSLPGGDKDIPEWMRDMLPVQTHPDGTTEFRSGRGANVFSGILFAEEGLSQTAVGLNPLLLVPIEWTFGFDTFRKAPFRVAPERAARQGITRSFRSGKAGILTDQGVKDYTPRPSLPLALLRSGLVPLPFFRQAEREIRGGPHDDVGTVYELVEELSRRMLGEPRQYPGAFRDPGTGEPFPVGTPEQQTLQSVGLGTRNYEVSGLQDRERQERLSMIKRLLKAKTEGSLPANQ